MANYFDQYDEPKKAPVQKQRYRGGYQPKSSPVQGFMSAMQGPTLGFLDEAVGGLSALGKIPQGTDAMVQQYRDARDAVRANVEDYEKDYPTLATLSRVAASAPTAVLLPQFKLGGLASSPTSSKAAVMGANMLRAGLTAGAYGAINAAGNSESEDGMGMLGDIALGGTSAAAMGGITPPVASVLGGGVRRIATSPLNPLRDKAVASFADRNVAESLLRDLPSDANVTNPTARQLAYQRWLGQGGRIVDVGDDATRGLLDVTANLPGKSGRAVTKAVEERMATRGGQMVAAADRALGTGGAAYKGTIDALEQKAITDAAPFYRQLQGVSIPVNGKLREVLQQANKHLGAADDYAASIGVSGVGLRQALVGTPVIDAAGNQIRTSVAPLSRFDALKQYLWDVEQGFVREGSKNQAASIGKIRKQLIAELDDLSPKDGTGQSIYKMARDAYAGPSQLRDAAEIGSKALGADKDFAISEAIRGMSRSEIDAMRVGLVHAIKEKAGTQSGQTWLINNWKNPTVRDRIKLAFGDQANSFIASLQKFGKMKKLEQVGVGSQTFRREAAADDLGVEPLQDLARATAAAKTGNLAGITDYIAKTANRLNVPEPVRNRISEILLMRGPEARAQLIKMGAMLEQLNRQQAAQAQVAGQFVGRINPWLMPEGQ